MASFQLTHEHVLSDFLIVLSSLERLQETLAFVQELSFTLADDVPLELTLKRLRHLIYFCDVQLEGDRDLLEGVRRYLELSVPTSTSLKSL